MQQKEVLIIAGLVIAGFFLLNNGLLSGRSTYGLQKDYDPYTNNKHNLIAGKSIYEQPVSPGAGTSTELCGWTSYPFSCSIPAEFGCNPATRVPYSDEADVSDPYRPSWTIQRSRDEAHTACQQKCSADISNKMYQAQFYCETYCYRYPGCVPITGGIVYPCSKPVCNVEVCATGALGGNCISEMHGSLSCLCVRAPKEA